MNEEEKKAIELLKIDCLVTSQQIKDGELFMIEDGEKMRISATQVLLNLIEKQQKEIEELKKQILQDKIFYYSEKDYISKDKLEDIMKKHKKFLVNEFSKYPDDDIENRKAIQYALARLSFLLTDILKED